GRGIPPAGKEAPPPPTRPFSPPLGGGGETAGRLLSPSLPRGGGAPGNRAPLSICRSGVASRNPSLSRLLSLILEKRWCDGLRSAGERTQAKAVQTAGKAAARTSPAHRLIGRHDPVGPGFRPADQGVPDPPNDLSAAEGSGVGEDPDIVPPPGQSLYDVMGNGLLYPDLLSLLPPPSRDIQGGLGIEMAVDRVDDYLKVSLGLHKAAHDTEGTDGPPFPGQKAGDNRMVGSLARLQTIGMIGIQGKIATAIVQADACARNNQAGAEPHIVALDEGDHIPLAVRGGQIDRPSLGRRPRKGIGGIGSDP